MPTYEYRCPDGHEFDHFFRSISSAQPVLPCPTCGRPAERKVSGGAGLVFKGSGFYITDYGKDGKKDLKAAAKSEGGDAGKGEGAKAPSGGAEGSSATGGGTLSGGTSSGTSGGSSGSGGGE